MGVVKMGIFKKFRPKKNLPEKEPTRYGETDFALEIYKISHGDFQSMGIEYLKEWYPAGLCGWYYRIWRPSDDCEYVVRFGPIGPFLSYNEVYDVANKAFEDSKLVWRRHQSTSVGRDVAES